MRRPLPLILTVAVVAILAVVLVRAARDEDPYRTDTTMSDASMRLAPADMEFVTRAAEANKSEIDLAQLAQHTTEHAGLKAFAEQLERDHEQANDQLEDLVDRKDVDLPGVGLPEPTEAQKATYEGLDKLEGAAFDRAWIDQIAAAHQASVDRYTKASSSADPDVKAFAARILPIIKTHLEHAQSLQKTLR